MNCRFTEKISSLIDGELSPAETREVERHLLTCAQCEEARDDFLSLRSQITSFEATLPAAVQNRALAKILSAGERKKTSAAFGLGWRWILGTGALALASLAIVAVIIGLVYFQQPEQVAVKTTAPVPAPTLAPAPAASPAPTVEPEKTEKNEKESNAPQHQPTPRRSAPVREPKPGEQFAAIPENVRPADAQTMTALHFEKAENLLRAFRNVRLNEPDSAVEVSYERQRAQQLVYQNMMLRREADAAGDVQIGSLLESLEPILLDIANLPDKPDDDSVRVIRERVERKNIVALLQVNSTALARALD
ncbi:MAG TPA: zf-HC2 domain-containing protein [Pyrinomonadaceae bacterium]|jgi:negative regulator of sigma E activity